ncbi:MAG: DUF664 domain-containing protein [Planctomycetota bacterium]
MGGEASQRLAEEVAREFRRRMLDDYVARIGRCLELLSEDEVWRKPSPSSNSIGNLLRHLEGNVRQWILCGVAGQPDVRDRDGEFAATGESESRSTADLLAALRATVTEAVEVVDGLGPDELLRTKRYQDLFDETGLGAVLHVMEHFSGHAGQIYAFTKQVKDVDLRFYDI